MLNSKLAKACGWSEYGKYDLIVVGAGPAGIGAAIAAGRRGLKVLLIESYGFAGGAGTKSCTPLYYGFGVSGKQSTAGLFDEFIRRMDKEGAASLILNDTCQMPEFAPIGNRELTAKVQLHPETMKLVYRRMLNEANVETLFYAEMVDAVVDADKITALLVNLLEGPVLIYADYFIDSTGDALMFKAAGAPVRKYSEEDGLHKSMFFFVGGVTPFNHEHNCELYKKAFDEGRLPDKVWNHFGYSVQLNPGVVQIAVCYAEGDALSSRDMTRMDMELRETVFEILDYLRREMPGFKNCYLLETSTHIGVRMAQGIVGIETLTKEMIAEGISSTDKPVALTSRSFGAHANGAAKQFMATWSGSKRGFGAVPMGALISPALSNALAAGRCISSDPHVISTYRMMNTCMTLGEAAGIMVSLVVGEKGDLRELEYKKLRPELDKAGFILEDK